jgi:hypothetical protein
MKNPQRRSQRRIIPLNFNRRPNQTSPLVLLPTELLVIIIFKYIVPAAPTLESLTDDDITTPPTFWVSTTLQAFESVCERRKALYNLICVSRRFYNLLANDLYDMPCRFIPDIRSSADFVRGVKDYRADRVFTDPIWAKHGIARFSADHLRGLAWVPKTKSLVYRSREWDDEGSAHGIDSRFEDVEHLQLLNCSCPTIYDVFHNSILANLKIVKIEVDFGISNPNQYDSPSWSLTNPLRQLCRRNTVLESLTLTTKPGSLPSHFFLDIGMEVFGGLENLKRLSLMQEHCFYTFGVVNPGRSGFGLPKPVEEFQVFFGRKAYIQFTGSEDWIARLLERKRAIQLKLRKLVVIGVYGCAKGEEGEEEDPDEGLVLSVELLDFAKELGVEIIVKLKKV